MNTLKLKTTRKSKATGTLVDFLISGFVSAEDCLSRLTLQTKGGSYVLSTAVIAGMFFTSALNAAVDNAETAPEQQAIEQSQDENVFDSSQHLAAKARRAQLGSVGQVMTEGSVTLVSPETDIDFEIVDDFHTLFSSDALYTTRESSALIRLMGDAGVIYAADGAGAAFLWESDTYVVDSFAGTLRFMFRPGFAFKIQTECYTIESVGTGLTTVANRAPNSTEDEAWNGGMVMLFEGEEVFDLLSGNVKVSERDFDEVEAEMDVERPFCVSELGTQSGVENQPDLAMQWLLTGLGDAEEDVLEAQ